MTHDLNRLLELSGQKNVTIATTGDRKQHEQHLREHLEKLREHVKKVREYLAEVERAPDFFVPQTIGPGGVPNAGTDQSIVTPSEDANTDQPITGSWGVPTEPSDLNQSKTVPRAEQNV